MLAFASSGRLVLPDLNCPSSSLSTTVKTTRLDALSIASVLKVTPSAFIPAAFASVPAAPAAWLARSAAACAPCAFWSVSLIAPSLRRVRSCVSSTDSVSVSTLVLTAATRVLTNPFVAHAGSPVTTRPPSVSADNHFLDMLPPVNRISLAAMRMPICSQQHIPKEKGGGPALLGVRNGTPAQVSTTGQPEDTGRDWMTSG